MEVIHALHHKKAVLVYVDEVVLKQYFQLKKGIQTIERGVCS
ncbi:hypothetical protein ABNC51_10100 [Paenibacillus larvae]